MKYFLIGTVLDTKSLSPNGFQFILQQRLDNWLGKGKTQIKVDEINDHTMKFTLYRKYGEWYEDPQLNHIGYVFNWDEIILLGNDCQTGTCADFESLPGRYIIHDAEKDFFTDYKEIARENHCTRIKQLSQQSYLDRIELTVELTKPRTKQHKKP